MKSSSQLWFLATIFFVLPFLSQAQIDATGFIRNYNAVLTTPDHEFISGRNRLRLDLNRGFSGGEITISNDIKNIYSASADSINYRLRQAYVDLYFKRSDLRVGKQIISWGRSEGTFITDILTPVDLTEFLTQDFADLRLGVTAIKYTHYFGSDYLQLVVNPIFNSNQLPSYQSRWFPRLPFETSIPIEINGDQTPNDLKDVQLAARYAFRSNLDYDLDVGVIYWNHPMPRYAKELALQIPNIQLELTEQYQQSFIGMYSGTLQLTDKLLLTSESAYYNSRLFDYFPDDLRSISLQNPNLNEIIQLAQAFNQNEDGFLKERPWLISMAGLQYSLGKWTLNGQYIGEYIFKYDDTILQEQYFSYGTLSTRRSFFREKLQLQVFGRYNIQGEDFWINPEATYTGIDALEVSAGTHLFGGTEPQEFYGHITYDTYAPNSFAYFEISAYF